MSTTVEFGNGVKHPFGCESVTVSFSPRHSDDPPEPRKIMVESSEGDRIVGTSYDMRRLGFVLIGMTANLEPLED